MWYVYIVVVHANGKRGRKKMILVGIEIEVFLVGILLKKWKKSIGGILMELFHISTCFLYVLMEEI